MTNPNPNHSPRRFSFRTFPTGFLWPYLYKWKERGSVQEWLRTENEGLVGLLGHGQEGLTALQQAQNGLFIYNSHFCSLAIRPFIVLPEKERGKIYLSINIKSCIKWNNWPFIQAARGSQWALNQRASQWARNRQTSHPTGQWSRSPLAHTFPEQCKIKFLLVALFIPVVQNITSWCTSSLTCGRIFVHLHLACRYQWRITRTQIIRVKWEVRKIIIAIIIIIIIISYNVTLCPGEKNTSVYRCLNTVYRCEVWSGRAMVSPSASS